MMILAAYSNKGGVGKTATAVNLSYLAARTGYRTLICDLDPQSATTFYFRVKPHLKRGLKGFIKGGKSVEKSIKGSDYPNLDLLPADFAHRNLDITVKRLKHSKSRLKYVFNSLKTEYDLIILDSPPTINILAENIFNVADYLLVPLIPTTLFVRTYQQLLSFFEQNGYNSGQIYAFFSIVDPRNRQHRRVAASVYREFDQVLHSPVPYFAEIEQMDIYREPVTAYAPNSAAAHAYQTLWIEVQAKMFAGNL